MKTKKNHLFISLLLCMFFCGCQYRRLPKELSLRQISLGEDYIYDFQWSPDQTKIAYAPDDESIVIQNVGDGDKQVIVTALPQNKVFAPLWSPDGKHLLYHWVDETQACPEDDWTHIWSNNKTFGMKHKKSHEEECQKLVFYNVESGESEVVNVAIGVRILNWNAEQESLIGVVRQKKFNQFGILSLPDLQLTYVSQERISHIGVANTVPYQYAALSPDGKWGVYAANDTGAQDQARLVNLAHPEREIIIESGNSGHYIWSPDSSQVAYFRIEEEFDPFTPSATITVHLYSAIDEKGRILSQIDFFSKGYAAPSWSPNGEFIALFVSTGWLEKNNNPEIGLLSLILIDVQNGQHKRYDFPEIQSSPMWMRWSEDSRKIYFDGISEILEISFPE